MIVKWDDIWPLNLELAAQMLVEVYMLYIIYLGCTYSCKGSQKLQDFLVIFSCSLTSMAVIAFTSILAIFCSRFQILIWTVSQ